MPITDPKYSVVLPTLNGAETLSVTMPAMLRAIERDDVEWLISDNHSDDNTAELIADLGDPRVRLVQPPQRLPVSQHLEFAYSQARGEWQGHIGDDDYLFPSRFTVLDKIQSQSKALVIRGDFVRYHWSNYPDPNFANMLNQRTYSNNMMESPGPAMATQSLNDRTMYGGGAWCVHRSIIEQIRQRCGYFSSPQHVEFFAMRAAMAISPLVACFALPIYVLGRHEKSSCAQAQRPRSEVNRHDWDWSFEDPDPWRYCPFAIKGYSTISFDAAMKVKDVFGDRLPAAQINWLYWIKDVYDDFNRLIQREQLPPKAIDAFWAGMKHVPRRPYWRWRLSKYPSSEKIVLKLLSKARRSLPTSSTKEPNLHTNNATRYFGWPKPIYGETVGIHNIIDVPVWVEKTYSWFF